MCYGWRSCVFFSLVQLVCSVSCHRYVVWHITPESSKIVINVDIAIRSIVWKIYLAYQSKSQWFVGARALTPSNAIGSLVLNTEFEMLGNAKFIMRKFSTRKERIMISIRLWFSSRFLSVIAWYSLAPQLKYVCVGRALFRLCACVCVLILAQPQIASTPHALIYTFTLK